MKYTLAKVFNDFYGVILEIGPNKTIKTKGMEKLSEDMRKSLHEWLNKYKDHVLERLQNEKDNKNFTEY